MALDLIIINGVTVQTLGYVEKNGLSTVDGRRNGKRYTFMVDGHEALLAIRNAGCNARFCYWTYPPPGASWAIRRSFQL